MITPEEAGLILLLGYSIGFIIGHFIVNRHGCPTAPSVTDFHWPKRPDGTDMEMGEWNDQPERKP